MALRVYLHYDSLDYLPARCCTVHCCEMLDVLRWLCVLSRLNYCLCRSCCAVQLRCTITRTALPCPALHCAVLLPALRCAVLCCAVLCCAALCYLRCAVLQCAALQPALCCETLCFALLRNHKRCTLHCNLDFNLCCDMRCAVLRY